MRVLVRFQSWAPVRLVTVYREEVELLVHQHRGQLVDFTGDNFLAEFGSAVAAVQCAIQYPVIVAETLGSVAGMGEVV